MNVPLQCLLPTPAPLLEAGGVTLFQGDSLLLLPSLPSESVDAVVTDPPYSSGGATIASRKRAPSQKYQVHGTKVRYPEFAGDARDQRSYLVWSCLWMAEALRVTRPGGVLMVFSDWRQLPTVSDALQAAGWVWKGVAVWDKTEGCRPQRGWFRSQCEYVLLGCNGSLGREQGREVGVCAPGCFRENVRYHQKQHLTAKPLALMARLLEVLPARAVVLDPFAGSGTTLVAARDRGLEAVGIEMSPEYCDVIRRRLESGEPS